MAGSHFDLDKINSLLSSTANISNNAEKFKTLFDNFQGVSGPAMNASLQSSGLSSVIPSTSNSSPDISLLKFYIDSKFRELEDKLMKKIDASTKQQNDKLDQILNLLTTPR